MNFAKFLPEDITVIIFDSLSFDDRAKGCFVNRTWNRLNRHQVLGPTLELHPKQVVNRSFLDWARGRLQYVQELQILPFKGSSTDIVTQRCLSSSLSEVTCVNVRSYGLVCAPSCLPPSLQILSLSTKSRGRRVGPSLMLPSAGQLPNLKDLKLEATCFICQDGGTSMTAFLRSLAQLRRVRLRSNAQAVNYGNMLKELSHVPVSRWEPL
ncbi:hypothetical protein WJX75_006509 [Coccomyxa subellipsoidea]|uniref:F-box domain-containing protein n=1 Tax=Coccomyxa subellipsoidea TaxID=248742 RepID=A0ABR2Z0V8_9CHLO